MSKTMLEYERLRNDSIEHKDSEGIERDFMLTTKDNPYDPWTQWDEWYEYDHEKGYCSCEYLGRIAITSSDMTDEENSAEISRAIEEIIRLDPFDLYRKAYEPSGKD